MKQFLVLVVIAGFTSFGAGAQDTSAVGNPVSSSVRQMVADQAKLIIAAAEEMPPDKYGYKPTPQQVSFGHLIVHLAESNTLICSAILATKSPQQAPLSETDPKEKLVAALKKSFDYCTTTLNKVDDSKIGEKVVVPQISAPRAMIMIALVADLYDHYSQAAMYLRMNGLLPPSAQPEKK